MPPIAGQSLPRHFLAEEMPDETYTIVARSCYREGVGHCGVARGQHSQLFPSSLKCLVLVIVLLGGAGCATPELPLYPVLAGRTTVYLCCEP